MYLHICVLLRQDFTADSEGIMIISIKKKGIKKMLKKLQKTVDIIKGVCYYLIVACERALNIGV